MNHFREFAAGIILTFALTAFAQQATTSPHGPTKGASGGEHAGVPNPEVQLKFLAARLDLTADQQEKIKPILQELHDASAKVIQDENMSREQRLSKVRDSHYAADKRVRLILSDDQKKKLDQLESEPHPELHGAVSRSRN